MVSILEQDLDQLMQQTMVEYTMVITVEHLVEFIMETMEEHLEEFITVHIIEQDQDLTTL